MIDVVGIFDEMTQARASAAEIVQNHIARRGSIELVEPEQGQELPEIMVRQVSKVRVLTAFVVAGVFTLLLSLATLTISGVGFGLAAAALAMAWIVGGARSKLLLQHRQHIVAGRTLLIVTASNDAVPQIVSAFRKHGSVETTAQ